jgi:hypothetical protein
MVDSLLYTSFESSNNALQKQNKPNQKNDPKSTTTVHSLTI